MKYVYGIFGMGYKLELSTRPKKALGDIALWNRAEAALASAMDDFAGKGGWRVNPGEMGLFMDRRLISRSRMRWIACTNAPRFN